MGSLMWIDCTQAGKRSQRQADALRQHVMLNHLAKKKSPAASQSGAPSTNTAVSPRLPTPGSSRCSSLGSSYEEDGTEHGTANATRQRRRQLRHRLLTPESPSPALVVDDDRDMYQALWWHNFQEVQRETTDEWKASMKAAFSLALQESAKQDETVGAMFMCLAAAKEAHIRSWQDSRAFRLHKGRALSKLAKAIEVHGSNIPETAVFTMSLLCRASIVEGDLEDAEVHSRGLSAVFSHLQLDQIPGPIWQFFVWADLRVTGVISRAPRMPFWIHPDYRILLPEHDAQKAALSANLGAARLPQIHGFLDGKVARILELLYQLSFTYNFPKMVIARAIRAKYEIAHLLASLQLRVHETGSVLEKLVLVSLQMQFWGTIVSFCPQTRTQIHLTAVLSSALSQESAQGLSGKWLASGATLEALLFVLFNVSAGILHHTRDPPKWLLRDMRYVNVRLHVNNLATFRQLVQRFPHSLPWTETYLELVFQWIKHGEAPDSPFVGQKIDPFLDLRLLFDADADVKPVEKSVEKSEKESEDEDT